METESLPIAVVGAGAAGLIAALFASRSGAPVVLLEGKPDGGRKILISGGGRCNILPSRAEPERYVTDSSPNTLRKILRSWPLPEQRTFFERELGLRLVLEPESGKLFPETNRARDVRDGLVSAVQASGVKMWFGTQVVSVRRSEESGEGWRLDLSGGPSLEARAVILATGGLSVPATGSDGAGLDMARRLGHTIHPTYPALTPLLAQPAIHADLAGLSLEVTLRAPGARPRFETTGGFLFTHRGYSGPAVLDISHLAVRSIVAGGDRQPLTVQWTPTDREGWEAILTGKEGSVPGGSVRGLLARRLPTRLAGRLLEEAGIPKEQHLSDFRRDARRAMVAALTAYPLPWTGDEGYAKAEVTGGGVALSEVQPATLESRRHAGLFLCGEILDAFGPIGGHNFLWAWATGRAAGRGAGGQLFAS